MIFGFGIMGALGGALIGLSLGIPGKIIKLSLTAGFGLLIGFTIMLFIGLTIGEPPFFDFVAGLTAGALTGAMMGAASGKPSAPAIVALTGALGFVIGSMFMLQPSISSLESFSPPLRMLILGVVGGAGIGVGFTLLTRTERSG